MTTTDNTYQPLGTDQKAREERIKEVAARVRVLSDEIVDVLRIADNAIVPLLKRARELEAELSTRRFFDDLDDADMDQWRELAGWEDVWNVSMWLCNRLEDHLGGSGGIPSRWYPGQRFGWETSERNLTRQHLVTVGRM